MQPNLLTIRPRAAHILSFFGPARGHNLFSFWGGLLFTLLVLGTTRTAFSQAPVSTTFSYNGTNGTNGSVQSFTVPTGVTQLTVVAFGAQGTGSVGGLGGQVNAVMTVTPGQVLNIYVGGQPVNGAAGGFNGGGAGGASSPGGGGGATDIRIGGTTLNDRVLVAGGGGGSGNQNPGSPGAGGGLTGASGSNARAGAGGAQMATSNGGTGNPSAGFGGANGTAGGLGQGGVGGTGSPPVVGADGGGGGGGYYGGGGGGVAGFSGGAADSGGGGGGSSFPATTNSIVTSVSHTQGVRAGHGLLTISYQTGSAPTPPTSPVSFSYNGTNGTDGSVQSFTVPTGVTQLTVIAFGAQGGSSNLTSALGGRVDAVMSVTAGQVLTIYVGGKPILGAGGFNGGGASGGSGSSGGGGGATDIRIGGTALSNRVLVAGAGGGKGCNVSFGGAGGGLGGGGGFPVSGGGVGGQQGNGGNSGGTNSTSGVLGIGGNGGGGGGGGGGGYYGGGGGDSGDSGGGCTIDASGGGGSSYTHPSLVTAFTHTQGVRSGDGLLTISYQIASLSLTTQATPVTSGTATASVTAVNGTGPFSYTWTAPTGIVLTPVGNGSSVQVSTTACVTGQQTLTVVATDNGASPPVTTSATVSLTFVGVSVSITAAPSLAVAPGGSVTLTASGATSYTWSDNSTANPLILPSVTSSTTLSVTGTTGFCSNTASAAVSLFSLSFVASPNPTSSTATVSVTATNRTGPFSYTWIAPADITLTGGSTSAVQAAANACISGVRTLTVTVEDGGAAPPLRTTSTVNLTFAGVSVSITATPSLTIAPGGSVTLTASGASSYTWSDNSTANPLILTNVNSAITVSVTGVTGLCSNTGSAAVRVVAAVAAATLSASTSVVCEGATVSVVGSTTSVVTSYQWFKDGPSGVPVSLGAAQRTATLSLGEVLTTQSGNYSLVVSDGVTSATSAAFSLTVIPQPTVTLVFNGATYGSLGPGMPLITLTSPLNANNLPFFQVFGGVQFERKNVIDRINGYEIRQVDTNTTGVFSIPRVGQYTITVTGANGCSRTVQGVIESR